MSKTETEIADSIHTKQERIEDFARTFGIPADGMEGGALSPNAPNDTERLAEIRTDVAAVMGASNVISLVFDHLGWDLIPIDLFRDTCHPAESVEEFDDEGASLTFTSVKGSRVLLTADYVDEISEFIGVDLRENPELVLMNSRDEFPVAIQDTKTEATILLAPRIAPGGW